MLLRRHKRSLNGINKENPAVKEPVTKVELEKEPAIETDQKESVSKKATKEEKPEPPKKKTTKKKS
ncbi:hypothetical protein SAMN05216249_10460 [Acetitomaculum ruminis DSM 5522]|uniref:Uncharacterized protein n=1 Tax=Acetitomaculum ruminis DSM 5522 TaxID=1120918 RepID=A0A1I0WHR6_9FIRM|nr:hypothetical protein [Acetitomaculum ruminis]SFA87660.1 hypothetical protein SAMN05216249_10460 [Acetitomaculum ruminis DSM 5522]